VRVPSNVSRLEVATDVLVTKTIAATELTGMIIALLAKKAAIRGNRT